MLSRLVSLVRKEFIQLLRDRLMLAFILVVPVSQLVLLAEAAGQGITRQPLAVLDRDRSPQSRALIQALDNMPELVWRFRPESHEDLTALIDGGRAVVALVIPAGFGESLARGEGRPLQVIVDGSNSAVGITVQSYVEGAVADYAQRLVRQAAGDGGGGIELRRIALYNPALNARVFTIPAQMGFIIYQVTLVVASLAFARERDLGTMEQLLVTPLRPIELIGGKAVPAWIIGGLDFLVMFWVAVALFHVPMHGSFALLAGLSLLFVAVEIAFGILISSFARSQQHAILYVFMLAMLDVALSGYLVPIKNTPAVFQAAAMLSPLQHYLAIIRAIMLKGADLALLWPRVLALIGIGLGVGMLALATARRNLE